MISVAIFVVSALLSWALTGVILRYALKHAIMDQPNSRSSHSVPTPRGGGAAIVAILLLSVAALSALDWLDRATSIALLGIIPIAWVGWIDDRRGVSPRTRASVHALSAVWALYWLGGMPSVSLGTSQVGLGGFGSVLALIGIVWSTNLYNFMDGIDGIAGVEAMTIGLAAAALLAGAGAPGLAYLSLATAGAALGFLGWNWAPARIFMGDVGSGVLGFWFAVLAVSSEQASATPSFLWGLLAGVFIVDATVTVVRRAARRESLHTAHRGHAYQRLVEAGWSHARVSIGVLAVNVLLAGLALIGARHPSLLLVAFGVGFAILLALYAFVERRAPMR